MFFLWFSGSQSNLKQLTFRIILIALSGVDTSSSYLTRRILPGKELAKFEASTMSMKRSEHSLMCIQSLVVHKFLFKCLPMEEQA